MEPQKDDGEPFEERMKRLVAELREQQVEGDRLVAAITKNLEALGFGLAASEEVPGYGGNPKSVTEGWT